jgi:Zn-dependent protease with chaperone function
MSSDDPVAVVSSRTVSFFNEQARRRRQARWQSAACLIIASGIGVVLSTVITPLLLILAGAGLRLLVRFNVFSGSALSALHDLGKWTAGHVATFYSVIDSLDRIHRFGDIGVTLTPLSQMSSLCLPGLATAALVWLVLRSAIARIGGEDLVLRLKCRAPNPHDLEERQLANVVDEMAIAAGLPAVRLLMIDSPTINAAAIGRSHRTATILVTRGLIDTLDRRETGGIVAHLIATVVQGDTGLSVSVLAVFQTLGFFLTLLDLPLRLSASRAIGGAVLVALGIKRSPEAVAHIGEMLEDGLNASSIEPVNRIFAWAEVSKWHLAVIAPLLPFILISLFMKLVLFLWTALLLGPPLGLLWRTRRYSADAVAVQLTRDPDALALGLQKIAGSSFPDGASGREYFFVHVPLSSIADSNVTRRGVTASLHPSLARRLARLIRMGANSVGPAQVTWARLAELSRQPARAALVLGLMLLLVPLVGALAILVAYVTALIMTIVLAAGLGIARAVLGG